MPTLLSRLAHAGGITLLFGAVLTAPASAQDGEQAASDAQATPSNIEKRLRRIEDSLIDMRAMIGALQSFAPGDGAAPAEEGAPSVERAMPETDMSGDGFAGSEDSLGASEPHTSAGPSPGLQQLEIQVQALSAQLSETVKRLNRLEQAIGRGEARQSEVISPPDGFDDSTEMAEQDSEQQPETGFGTTTVEPPAVPDDDMASQERMAAEESEAMPGPASEAGSADAQAIFAQAYDAMQAQDYAAARDGFQEFLDNYPDDPLANDARFWLADAAFAEGDYVQAANTFVKVYNTAPTGEKSEETLLKLAIVLRRLDRPESACDALSRLDGRLDAMSEEFRERVDSERRRSGCG